MVETERGNFVGDYPPVFYYFAGLFTGSDIAHSVLVMRLVNALLIVAMVSATYLAAPPKLRKPLIGGIVVTAVPLGMFLIPSVNPSSWAVLSAATLLVCVLGYMTSDERNRRLGLGALAALSVLIGGGARADSAMYAVVAVVAGLVLSLRFDSASLRRAVYPAVLAILAGVSYLLAGQGGVLQDTSGERFSIGGFAQALVDSLELWAGALGKTGLGWLDTMLPPLVGVAAFGIFLAMVFAAISRVDLRGGLALGLVALVAWAVPAYIKFQSELSVQPRYVLPLLTLLAGTAMVRMQGKAFGLGSVQRWVLVLALSVANSVALHANLRRYVTGIDQPSLNLDAGREWWWDGVPFSPMGLWALGSVAFALGLALLSRELARVADAEVQPDRQPSGPLVEHDGTEAMEALPATASGAGSGHTG